MFHTEIFLLKTLVDEMKTLFPGKVERSIIKTNHMKFLVSQQVFVIKFSLQGAKCKIG